MLLPALLVILVALRPQIFFRKYIRKARQRRYVRNLIGVIANLNHKCKKPAEPSRDKACRFVFAFCVFAVFVFSVYVRCGVLIIFIRVFTRCSARLHKNARQKQQRKRGCVPKRTLMLYLVKNFAKRALGGFNIKFLPLARIRALIRRARFKFYCRAIRALKFRPTRFKFRRLAIRLFKFGLALLR